jgi:hypothetical protein
MRSGSSAQDGSEWPSAQRPYPDEATSGPVQYGPEISWPNGFRQLDQQSREVLESAYGPDRVYQQPAMDDYGYGDPGYSDPSYDGPKAPYAGPKAPYAGPTAPYASPGFPGGTGGSRPPAGPRAFDRAGYPPPGTKVPGYHVPEIRDSARPGYAAPGYRGPGYQPQDFAASSSGSPDSYPVAGVQEPLPDTGPRPADPRLAGMRYDELRYDEPSPDARGFDEPLDDDSWVEELRRSAPAYPQTSGEHPSGPVRRVEPQAPAFGQQAGYPQPPAPERFGGYGQPRGDWGGSGPQMSAGRMMSGPGPRTGGPSETGRGSWPGGPSNLGVTHQPGSGFPPGPAGQGTGFLGAPTAQVGVLTPPDGSRMDVLPGSGPQLTRPGTDQFPAAPIAARSGSAPVRPGHGLDGPAITSSWPAQPQADELESFEEFWREDANDGEYKGLFGDKDDPEGARLAAKRGIGRRRGGSNDHRLWLGLGGVVIIAAAAIVGIIKFEFPSHGGPVHTMGTPARIGTYARTVDLERSTNVAQLRDEVIKMSSGQASRVVSAVYESGDSAAGNNEQIIMFIGGHLANAAPATSIASFTQKFPGAKVVAAGSLAGKAACVEEGGGASDSVSMCAWFDNDSFGEIVSPTMNAATLADAMITVRPAVEQAAKK